MDTIHSQLLVIGAGPGGYEIAAEQAAHGHSVTIIERDLNGGTCLNRGCIPTKCLSDAAGQLPAAPPSEDTPRPYNDQWQKARAKADAVVDALRDDVDALLRGCRVVHGSAKITPQGTVEVNGTEYSADRILIATGSAPATLDIPGAALVITSDDILSAATLPPAIAVIGGGVIALELADILGAFGVAVTVLEYCPEILPAFEADVAKRLRSTLSRRGIKFVVGARVSAICRDADGGILHVQYTDAKGRDAEVSAPAVLMAVGRRAVIPDGCAEAGIDTDRRGCIVTDDNFQTTREGIYAVGDANGKCMLAHAATAQAHRALGADVDLSVMPSAVFTHPEVAMVGMTTEACKNAGVATVTGKAMYASSGKARAMGATDGFVKVVADATDGRILGVHIIGAHASDIIDAAAVAISAKMDAKTLGLRVIHAHPTLAELLGQAARAAAQNLA